MYINVHLIYKRDSIPVLIPHFFPVALAFPVAFSTPSSLLSSSLSLLSSPKRESINFRVLRADEALPCSTCSNFLCSSLKAMQVTKKESTKTVANTLRREGAWEQGSRKRETVTGRSACQWPMQLPMVTLFATCHLPHLQRLTQRLSFITCKATPLWLWL